MEKLLSTEEEKRIIGSNESNEELGEQDLEKVTEKLLNFEADTLKQFNLIVEKYPNIPAEKVQEISFKYQTELNGLFKKLKSSTSKVLDKFIGRPLLKTAMFAGNMIDGSIVEISRYIEESNEQKKKQQFTEKGSGFEKKLSDNEILDFSKTLSEIKKLPTEEKNKRMEDYNETLSWYRYEIAERESAVIQKIFENPDATPSELFAIVDEAFSGVPLSNEIEHELRDVLSRYYTRHEKVREMRKKFPDDKALFKELFDVDSVGRVEIKETPISFYIRAHNEKDYAEIHNLGKRLNTGEPLSEEDIKRAGLSGGVKIYAARQEEMEGGIIAENAQGIPFFGEARRTFQHEQEHALQDFFKEEFNNVFINEKIKRESRLMEKPSDLEPLLLRHFRMKRQNMEAHAKDEIFAYFLNNQSLSSIESTLLNDKGLYTYYADGKEYYDFVPRINGPSNIKEISEPLAKKVYEDEYKTVIKDSLESIKILRKNGVPKNIIIRMFTHEPLRDWKKITKKLVDSAEK